MNEDNCGRLSPFSSSLNSTIIVLTNQMQANKHEMVEIYTFGFKYDLPTVPPSSGATERSERAMYHKDDNVNVTKAVEESSEAWQKQ